MFRGKSACLGKTCGQFRTAVVHPSHIIVIHPSDTMVLALGAVEWPVENFFPQLPFLWTGPLEDCFSKDAASACRQGAVPLSHGKPSPKPEDER